METKKCPFCAEDIKKEALVCKHCGKDFKEEKKKKKTSKFSWLLMILFIVGCGYLGLQTPPPSTGGGYESCSLVDKNKLNKYLKSPSSVEFISCYKDGNKIKGIIDADNSFGAKIRSHFNCVDDECVIK